MTRTGAAARPQAINERPESFLDWIQLYRKWIVGAAVVVAVAAAGFWFYMRSNQIRAANAQKQLMTAEQSVSTGNQPLAISDLEKLVQRYAGTPAATDGAMLLAQLEYDAGAYQKGIDALNKVVDDRASTPMRGALLALIADGYSELGKPADAATWYQKAADQTRFDADRVTYRAQAARALTNAGKTDEARKIWADISNQGIDPGLANEARVRLGELEAKPARTQG